MARSPTFARFASVLLALAMLIVMPAAASASSDELLATALTGAQEVPAADPDGIGAAAVLINPDTGRVCWAYAVKRVAPILAAHIHRGVAGVNGPVLVTLAAPRAGTVYSIGCTSASPVLAAEIVATPANFYVNVHNADFPGGALRGQLHG